MMEEVEALKFTSSGLFWDESYRASQVLRLTQQEGTAAQLRGLLALCNTAVVDVKPKHWEVQRRLSWFISSLFMDVPRPAPVARMQSWSVLTPFYAEDLLYSAKELALKNEVNLTLSLSLSLTLTLTLTLSLTLSLSLSLSLTLTRTASRCSTSSRRCTAVRVRVRVRIS